MDLGLLLVHQPALGTDPSGLCATSQNIPWCFRKWCRIKVLLWAVCRVRRAEEDKEIMQVRGRGCHTWLLLSLVSVVPLIFSISVPWVEISPQAATESPLGADFPSLLYSEVRSQQMRAFHRWLCLTHIRLEMEPLEEGQGLESLNAHQCHGLNSAAWVQKCPFLISSPFSQNFPIGCLAKAFQLVSNVKLFASEMNHH